MRYFRTRSFVRALRKRARRERCLEALRERDDNEKTMSSIDIDFRGFYEYPSAKLGELGALVLHQAQLDGVSQVRFHYGCGKMVYTIADVDYDIVPLPPPSNVDFARLLVRASRTTWNTPGSLRVPFADCTLDLTVSHERDSENQFVAVTGFTGESRVPCVTASPGEGEHIPVTREEA